MSRVEIDTGSVVTDTIQYVATENGLASTTTRTVIIEPTDMENADASSTAGTSTTAATSSPQ